MKAFERLATSYVAVASAGMIVLAAAHYRASQEPYAPSWLRPHLEFHWLTEKLPSAVSSRVAKLLRLTPPTTASEQEAPPAELTQLTPELKRVKARLRNDLTRELYDNFKLFLYVSKAPAGPVAQHMYVFEKRRSGRLALLYDWAVSTGREQKETDYTGAPVSTETPAGYFELDPDRLFPQHVSSEWRESMPYAMFFNWIKDREKTGLAIHAATGSGVSELGSRASAGCIRLAPQDARTLFHLVRDRYRGRVPRFAIDARTGTMNPRGIVSRNARGHVEFTNGYKVLVLVDNYGGENYVAAMF